MKIVLNGAPGSGKTKLAYELQDTLEVLGEGYYHIIDHYAEDLAERYDFGIGPIASHITDLAVMIERLGKEYYARNVLNYKNFIVCGSIAETAINTALTCDILHTDVAWETGQIMAGVFPLIQRSSGISHNFLLPLGDDPDDYETLIGDSLPEALEALGIKYHVLNPFADTETWIAYILTVVLEKEFTIEDIERLNDTEDSIEGPGEVGELPSTDG